MTPYQNHRQNSGVIAYDIGSDDIKVEFRGGRIYAYTYRSAGRDNVEKMKGLALAGEGLSAFISQHRPGYEGSR